MTDRKKPGVAFWATVLVVVVLVVYPASYPWIYLGLDSISTNRNRLWASIDYFYAPMSVLQQMPESIHQGYAEYWYFCGTTLKRMGLACKDWRP